MERNLWLMFELPIDINDGGIESLIADVNEAAKSHGVEPAKGNPAG